MAKEIYSRSDEDHRLNRFDVILATHSPQLIGRWGDLVVELGKVDGIDDYGEDAQ